MPYDADISSSDTYRPPPAPMPYDADIGRSQTPPDIQEFSGNKNSAAVRESCDSLEGTVTVGSISSKISAKCESLKESGCEVQTNFDTSAKQPEIELLESPEEEDVCPTCLEEYNVENPKIITKCEHHFHLACILEWMERRDTCPVCDKEMMFSPCLHE